MSLAAGLDRAEPRLTPRTIAIVVAAWTSECLVYAFQQILYHFAAGEPAPFREIFYSGGKGALIWSTITILLIGFRVAPRLRERTLPVILGVHFVLALTANGVDVGLDLLFNRLTGILPFGGTFAANFFRQSTFNIFAYFLTATVLHALELDRLSKNRALHAARLEGQLSKARLEVLKMQLQPHFLFNTLHAMAALVHDDPHSAERMILGLGDLLRAAVDQGGRPVIPLADEMALLQAYLDIEQIRFRGRLTVTVDVPAQLEQASVPNLILQPLVENAIKHGAARQLGPASIRVAVSRVGDDLELQVSNTGDPAGVPVEPTEGVGMRNTRARLVELYPGRHAFGLTVRPEGGAVVTIRMPYSVAEDEDSATDWSEEPNA
jgi:two-component system LytT family sensor kinase